MTKKKCFLVILTALAVLFVSGCKQNVGTPEDNAVVEEPGEGVAETVETDRLFGFSCPDMKDPFYEVLKESVATSLQEQGDRILVRDAGADADLQVSQIQEMIDEGVEAVFLSPVDPDSITPALEALREADIPVVNLEVRVAPPSQADAFIGSDNYNAGKVCGEDLMANRPNGGSLVIVECSEISSVNERITGFEETIADAGFEIVERIDTKRDDSFIQGKLISLLAEGRDIDAIMCGNDRLAVEVLTSLETAGRDDILVYSVGGSPDVKSALADPGSPMTGVGALSPITMGKTAVQTMSALLAGSMYETETFVETFIINRDNVNMYGTDGWQ